MGFERVPKPLAMIEHERTRLRQLYREQFDVMPELVRVECEMMLNDLNHCFLVVPRSDRVKNSVADDRRFAASTQVLSWCGGANVMCPTEYIRHGFSHESGTKTETPERSASVQSRDQMGEIRRETPSESSRENGDRPVQEAAVQASAQVDCNVFEKELQFFKLEEPKWIRDGFQTWFAVVKYVKEVSGIWWDLSTTFDGVYERGLRHFGNVPMLIKQIGVSEPRAVIPFVHVSAMKPRHQDLCLKCDGGGCRQCGMTGWIR